MLSNEDLIIKFAIIFVN